MNARLLVSLFLGAFALAATAHAQPTLTTVTPGALAPGKTIDLTLNGTKFHESLSVWASFPAKLELVPIADPKKVSATQRVCRVTVDPNVAVQIGGLIVATKDGYSDPLLLMIDDLPSLAENGTNLSFEKAQDVSLPAAIDGAGNAGVSDFYRFQVQAGQRVAVEAVAGRMATDFDPVIRLFDASGKQLLVVDDDPAIGSDCRFSYTFTNAGPYVLEIRDNQFRANGRYRLRIGDFPLITAAYPLGGQAGVVTKFTFLGPDVGNVAPVDITPPVNAVGGRWPVSAKLPNGVSSGMAVIATTALPESVEVEPNNDVAKATPIKIPGAVSGRFENEKDRDFFQFDAKKGQRLAFRACGRSYGSPVYLKMYLQKADGKPLAESAVSEADEETLTFTFTEDGSYRLAVEDLLKRSGPDFVYRVSVDTAPRFSLSFKADKKAKAKFTTAKNGVIMVDVPVARDGYDGPITLSLEGTTAKFQLINNVIPEKQAAGKLIIVPPPDARPGEFTAARIVGRANVNGQEFVATLSTGDLVHIQRPAIWYPPAWLDGLLGLSISPETKPLYTATLDKPALQVGGQGGKAEFTVALERIEKDFKDPLAVTLINLPANTTQEVKREGNGPKETYKVTLKFAKDVPYGKSKIRVVNVGDVKGQSQAIIVDLPLEIAAPLAVSVAPAGEIVFGNQQKVRVTVTRLSASDKQPVTLKWKNLPAGVTSPDNIAIAADKDSVEVELTAAATAEVAKINNLAVVATTKFQGQDVTVESAPLGLEIKK